LRKEKSVKRRWSSGAAVAAVAFVLAAPAHAGAKGRRNTAAVLGAAAVYEAIQGHGAGALLLGAGAVGAYGRYRDARDRERYDDYRYRYRRGRYRDYDYDRDRDGDGRYGVRARRHEERSRYGSYDDYVRDRSRYQRERDRDRGGRYYLDRD
jgi:hypothetical protein